MSQTSLGDTKMYPGSRRSKSRVSFCIYLLMVERMREKKRCAINIYRVAHLYLLHLILLVYNIIIMAVVACGVAFDLMRSSCMRAGCSSVVIDDEIKTGNFLWLTAIAMCCLCRF